MNFTNNNHYIVNVVQIDAAVNTRKEQFFIPIGPAKKIAIRRELRTIWKVKTNQLIANKYE